MNAPGEPLAVDGRRQGVALSRVERVGWAIVVLSMVGAFLYRPLVTATNPSLAVSLAFHDRGGEYGPKVKRDCGCLLRCGGEDPWGNPWHFVQTPPGWKATPANDRYLFGMHTGEQFWPYSAGPNGVHEGGTGDDLFPTTWNAHNTGTWRDLRGDLVTGSLWLLWMMLAARCVRARRSSRGTIETLRVGWLAAGPTVASVWLVSRLGVPGQDVLRFIHDRALAPLPVVIFGSIALPWVLAATWIRLRKSVDPESD